MRYWKHAESNPPTPEYNAWVQMIRRCKDGRSIYKEVSVCERWLTSYDNFLADVGRRPSALHSLDRVGNAGNYEPGNVRWATDVEQSTNRRSTHWIEFNGERRTLKEWSERLGIPPTTISTRLTRGWSIADALKPGDRRKESSSRWEIESRQNQVIAQRRQLQDQLIETQRQVQIVLTQIRELHSRCTHPDGAFGALGFVCPDCGFEDGQRAQQVVIG